MTREQLELDNARLRKVVHVGLLWSMAELTEGLCCGLRQGDDARAKADTCSALHDLRFALHEYKESQK